MTHLNELSKVYLDEISEALSPEQRAVAQQLLDKETGADKKKAETAAKKKRSEIRKDKELELKQANLKIRQDREARRKEDRADRSKDKAAREKADALKAKQRDLAKNVSDKTKAAAGASKAAQASLASAKPKETITDKDGDGTALGKLGANAARGVAGVAGATLNTVKSIRLRQQAKKGQAALDKTKVQEDTLLEVDEVDSKEEKTKKVIDVMRGKNKVEVNPKLKAEGVNIDETRLKGSPKGVTLKPRYGDHLGDMYSNDPDEGDLETSLKDSAKKRRADTIRPLKQRVKATAKKMKKEEVEMEGVVDMVKKGAKRHSKAIEKKKIKNRKAVPYAALGASYEPEGEMVEDVHSGQGEKIAARTKKWMDKKGQKGAPGLDAMKARTAEHKAKRGVKEDVKITDAKGRDFLEIIDIIKPEPMKSPKNTVQWTEEKIAKLMKKANEKKRKNALQINKIVGTQ